MTSAPSLPEDVRALVHTTDGYLLVSDANRLGVTRRDISRWTAVGLLERVVRGVYAAPKEARTREAAYRQQVLAVIGRYPGEIPVIAGPAAVALRGLPLLGATPKVVHVAARRTRGRKPGEILQPIGELPPHEVDLLGAIRVCTPGRAALDTARFMTVTAGLAAADAALRAGATSIEELEATCTELARTRGVERARRTTRLASQHSESPGESWSVVRIDDAGLPSPQRQHSFFDDDGLIGRVDFWWPKQRVVGEFDGRIKYGRANPSGGPGEDVLWEEKRREDRLRAQGLTVIRWTTEDLIRPHRWLTRLTTALRP